MKLTSTRKCRKKIRSYRFKVIFRKHQLYHKLKDKSYANRRGRIRKNSVIMTIVCMKYDTWLTLYQKGEKVIFNFSKYVLSDIEKKLLAKGLNFCLPPKQLKYADYLVHFELFYRDIRNLEILSNEDLDFVKTKTKKTASLSFRQYNKTHNKTFLRKNLQL